MLEKKQPNRVLKVLVVDDSAYVRKVVSQMLTRSPFIEVVGIARDGIEALDLVEELSPDVVTLDLIMPRMNGIEFLNAQMAKKPVPVVVVSIASESGEMALNALDAGAVEFVQKPTALATDKIFEISEELVEKVKAAAQVSPVHLAMEKSGPEKMLSNIFNFKKESEISIVVIGTSTGGPQALKQVIPQLPSNFPVPVAIVLHMPVGYTEMYAEKLNGICPLKVVEAKEGNIVESGMVFLAPAGKHMKFIRQWDGTVLVHLDIRPFDTPHRPSVDVLFQSAAETYGSRVMGVVMTGMGSDGRQGSAWIKSQGGIIITESEDTCVVYGMPGSVVEANLSDINIPLDIIAKTIMENL